MGYTGGDPSPDAMTGHQFRKSELAGSAVQKARVEPTPEQRALALEMAHKQTGSFSGDPDYLLETARKLADFLANG